MPGRAPASAFWPHAVPEVPGRARCGNGEVPPPQEVFTGGTAQGAGPLGPKAPSHTKGSRVRKAAWAPQRARRAGKKEAT